MLALLLLSTNSSSAVLGATALIVAIGLTARPKTSTAIVLLVVLLPFNDLTSSRLSGPSSIIYGSLKDILVLVLLVALIFNPEAQRRTPRWLVPLLTVLLLSVIGAALGTASHSVAVYGLRNDYEPLLLLLVVPVLVRGPEVEYLLRITLAVLEVATALAAYTWLLGVPYLAEAGVGRDDAGNFPVTFFSTGAMRPRAFGSFAGPNELAMACLVALVITWLLASLPPRTRLLLMVMPGVALLLSGSRSGLLGALVAGTLVLLRTVSRSRRAEAARVLPYVILVVGVLAFAFFIVRLLPGVGSSDDTSTAGHVASLKQSLGPLLSHPIGYGVGTVGPRAAKLSTSAIEVESFLLVIALEAGWVPVLAYLSILFGVIRTGVRHSSRSVGRSGSLAFISVAVVAGSAINQAVLPTLQTSSLAMILWLVVGLSISASLDDVGVRTPLQPRPSPPRGTGTRRGAYRPE